MKNSREPSAAPVLGDLLDVTTSDILDYFAKCPHCGYAIQASEIRRRFSRGLIERTLHRTCGLPCGWSESSQVFLEALARADDPPRHRIA